MESSNCILLRDLVRPRKRRRPVTGFRQLEGKAVRIMKRNPCLRTDLLFSVQFNVQPFEPVPPEAERPVRNRESDACHLPGSGTALETRRRPRKERQNGPRRPSPVRKIEVVGFRVIVVDGLFYEPEPEDPA